MLVAPRYGQASLADLVPSVLAGLDVPGENNALGLDLTGINRVCIFLVDGMGAQLLAGQPDAAPFLSSLTPTILTVGFPSTTATSLSSLGSGLPPGEHGIVGYLLAVPGHERLMNPLKWKLHGPGDRIDLLKELVPEQFQPIGTAFERATAAGISVSRVAPMYQGSSGLSRAALRGGEFRPNFSMGDLADGALTALRSGDRSLVYAYHGELDLTGHVRGPHSEAWAMELQQVDLVAKTIAEGLPSDAMLIVTADHGMVEVTTRVDFDKRNELKRGVKDLGGEPRARHVYTEQGAARDVQKRWQEALGDGFGVFTRDEVIANGWFGPIVSASAESRIGDVVVVSLGSGAVVRSAVEPLQTMLIGHHGSLTEAEMLVPMLAFR
ncbi:alkaline phosphatase family protein [Antrihabitans stalactiti]|uniref:Alkaline phosphatase family protein n=1 Tax=Antrihabitans stalactiti TaxID=2584121 RepID=A0A848KRC8_9NOCA|nr:alkaline phosphatase family protein [Antrihabitans stalactiti]NMN98840.1 alkaline phosphatase family protein [Antrihabitans stalactiti]